MKKSLLTIVSLILLLTFASAYTSKMIDGNVGYIAPNLYVSNNDTAISLQNMKGKYVLLSFWSSADAESRISNIKYDDFAQNNNDKLHLIAVNYDRDEVIYKEITKRDKLQGRFQFFDHDGVSSQVFSDYHLDQGYKSYLINPEGKIIANNPSTSTLAKLISQ